MSLSIHANSQILWRYRLLLADGYLVEENESPEGDIMTLGEGAILDALEKLLIGLCEGDQQQFIVMADDAFGQKDPEAVQVIPRNEALDSLSPEVGQVLSFSLPSGEDIPGTVLALSQSEATIDFNHPLAGHNIHFEVEILKVSS